MNRENSELIDNLTSIYGCAIKLAETLPPGEELNGLRKQSERIDREIQRLIKTNVDQKTARYNALNKQFKKATLLTHQAIEGINNVTDAIAALAKIADLAAKL